MSKPDCVLYSALREAVPIIDAALDKIVRLTGGFHAVSSDPSKQAEVDDFVRNVKVGANLRGLRQFANIYLDSLLTYGNAVGEVIPDTMGSDIYALYNADPSNVHILPGKTVLESQICIVNRQGKPEPVKHPDLVFFTPLNPPAGEIRGVSLLRSLPFVSSIFLKIMQSLGVNFERIANLRYAVTYKPGNSGVDKAYARDIADNIASEWSNAMNSVKNGDIRDFVAIGDVDIKVIGADNQMIDTEVPVRQILEQIIAKLGIPPFMLGLHWSSTERMSVQQADILTSELESYRYLLEGVLLRIFEIWRRLRGYGAAVSIVWDDINLQDLVEEANARLINARAEQIECELKEGEKNETNAD